MPLFSLSWLALVGALLFVTNFVDAGAVSLVVWLGLTLITVAIGVSALRVKEAN